jgi:hypothetical protein
MMRSISTCVIENKKKSTEEARCRNLGFNIVSKQKKNRYLKYHMCIRYPKVPQTN